MKRMLTSLAIAAMVFAGAPMSATAQISSKELEGVRAQLSSKLKTQETVVSIEEISGLGSSDAKVNGSWLKRFTRYDDSLKFASVTYGIEVGGELKKWTDHNVILASRLVQLDKLRGTKFHKNGDDVPIYVYNPGDGTKRPYIVTSYELGGNGTGTFSGGSKKPQPREEPELAQDDQQKSTPSYDDEVDQEQGSGRKELAIGEIRTINGVDHTYLGLDDYGLPAYVPASAVIAYPGDQTQTQGSDARTASITRSVTVSGDQDLLNGDYSGTSKGQSGSSSQGATLETKNLSPGEFLVVTPQDGRDPYLLAEGKEKLTNKQVNMMLRHNYDLDDRTPTDATIEVVRARHQSNIVRTVGGGGIMGLYQGASVTCPGQGFYLSGGNWICGNGGNYNVASPTGTGYYSGAPSKPYGPRQLNPYARR